MARRLNFAAQVAGAAWLFVSVAHANTFGEITRYARGNGSPDMSLLGTGRIIQTGAQASDVGVAVDTNGSVVVASNLFNGGTLVGRYLSSGSPDNNFGVGGVFAPDAAHNSEVHAVGVDSMNRVYALYDKIAPGGGPITGQSIARLSSIGRLDTTYKN